MPFQASVLRSRDLLRAGRDRLSQRLQSLDSELYGPDGQIRDHLSFQQINALLDAEAELLHLAATWMFDQHEQLIGNKELSRPG